MNLLVNLIPIIPDSQLNDIIDIPVVQGAKNVVEYSG